MYKQNEYISERTYKFLNKIMFNEVMWHMLYEIKQGTFKSLIGTKLNGVDNEMNI